MVLPLVKLVVMGVKQLAKPVSNRIKASAIQSNALRSTMVKVGRQIRFNGMQIERIADGKSLLKRERVPKINEKEALERGAEFLGEMFIYGVSVLGLAVEQMYSQRKAAEAAATEAEKLRLKEASDAQHRREFEQLRLQVAALQRRLASIERKEGEHEEESRGRNKRKRGWLVGFPGQG
uniref:OPA3-like protein n=1 Tax=Coccolithus braarudii TaxID=221442 RepID=A0A7S0LHK1_9EUKA|mmetsp:Transcript_40397/g.86122  ORF Transcript_40397/g.86122 Transcript_40397/m.86122 type:complete len:179 (+) Transcript_40397:130-666(+)